MKTSLVLAAGVAMTAAPALAATATVGTDDSRTMELSASVQPECSLDDPATFDFGAIPIVETAGVNALKIGANDTTPAQTVWLSCNFAARITMESDNQGMINPLGIGSADPAEFTDVIHYRMGLSAPEEPFGSLLVQTTLNRTATTPAPAAFHSDATLQVWIDLTDNAARRPVAGSYADVARISLGPV